MKELRADDKFSNAVRAELVARVQKTSAARTRKRARLWLGAGVLAGTGLLGGIGAAAAGLFVLPGGQQVTPLASPVAGTYTGTATVDLGAAPDGTTGITMELTCLSPGRFEFDDGASSSCSATDVGTRSAGRVTRSALQEPQPTSPEDAVKNFSTPRPQRDVPVFLSDGETQVGVFRSGG